MVRAHHPLYAFLGFIAQGDLAGVTLYTRPKRRRVAFLATTPAVPPSALQTTQRNRFRLAAQAWRSYPEATRAAWRRATALAHLRITAYNAYLHCALRPHDRTRNTLERQTGIALTTTPIP